MAARPADAPLASGDRPRLTARARLREDPVRGGWVLLGPEVVLLLNPTAAAVLGLCDGQRCLADVVAGLAGRYRLPAAAVAPDVIDLLGRLRARGLVAVAPVEEGVA
jgi:pyrroloquinoline quinone biosynthesis protein D